MSITKSFCHSPSIPRQRGFSLIEVLVAIVVISFGLLGVAALQANGLKNTLSAYHRTTASVLAYDMLDRMRVNKAALVAGNYDTEGNFWNYAEDAPATASTLKDIDLRDWLLALSKRLPAGAGKIEAAAQSGNLRVTIQWDDTRGTNASGSEIKTLSVEAQGCGTDKLDNCNF